MEQAEGPPFGTSERVADGLRVVAVTGELDLSTAPALERQLLERPAGVGGVVLDLCETDFVDSAGVRLIVGELRRCEAEGVRFAVACGPSLRRLLETCGVAAHLRILDRADDAVGA